MLNTVILNTVWTFEAESQVAHAIRAAEGRALLELAGVDVAQRILRAVPARAERTRAAAVGRIAAAVQATREAATRRPELRTRAARAMVAWRRSEELAWELAMSAQRISTGEARKLVSPYLDEDELTQEGFIGLLYAARRFEPQRGLRFSTYARWWVRAHMSRAIENASRLVRLPSGVVEQRRNLSHAAEELGWAGLSADRGALATQVGFRPKRVELLLGLGAAVNLDQLDADGHGVLDHLVSEDEAETRQDAVVSRTQLLRKLSEGFDATLNPSERFILTNHFGLNETPVLTRVEIGGLMSMSRERVRVAELGALRRLHRMLTTQGAAPRRSQMEHRG
ncbi:MAG: sigma-70 family RNA polymerase sigma factor [Deltaproteobacteria bacterium]|nr:sigma-70 family RNA polymerase sigma factor [Deltaproteobacteria bacterium]